MISRREFLKSCGVSVLLGVATRFLGGRIGAGGAGKQLLPLILSESRGAACPAPAMPRIAYNERMSGFMRASPADTGDAAYKDKIRNTLALLDYFAALGYSHILYGLETGNTAEFSRIGGTWVYNGGHYGGGSIAYSLQSMKEAVEARHMRLIPAVNPLSYVHHFIEIDPLISEFTWDPALPLGCQRSFLLWLQANNLADKNLQARFPLGRIAYLGSNPGMDAIFAETLRIIAYNWHNTPCGGAGPDFFHIGHDELGEWHACCIKADRSAGLVQSRAALVAAEIARRQAEITAVFGLGTQVMLWGDSLLPADNGELYDLAGDPVTGAGGVLQRLRDEYQLADKLLIMPWAYSTPEGAFFINSERAHTKIWVSKVRQLAYLDRLGFRYMPCCGEAMGLGGANTTDALREIARTKQTTFEWQRAAQMYPRYLAGLAHLGFGEFQAHAGLGVSHDYNACLLAYLGWQFGERSRKLARHNSYGPRVFAGVQYGLSSREQQWTAGRHFGEPHLQSSLRGLARL